MSGDPFKILHEQKASRMLYNVKQAHKTTMQTMMGVEEKKRILQPSEGQVLSFLNEEMRPALNKIASQKN